MRLSASELRGCHVRATDGDVGKLHDWLFDATTWKVENLVVSIGPWLMARKVLVSPGAVQRVDPKSRSVHVGLTRAEVRASPERRWTEPSWASEPKPAELAERPLMWPGYETYGIVYWPMFIPPTLPAELAVRRDRPVSDDTAQLASVRDMIGYRVEALDGELGHVADFVLDDTTLAIERIVADPGRSRESLLVWPRQIRAIDRLRRSLRVDFKREEAVKQQLAPRRAA